MLDAIWRSLQTVRILKQFWGRSALAIQPIDVTTDRTPRFMKMPAGTTRASAMIGQTGTTDMHFPALMWRARQQQQPSQNPCSRHGPKQSGQRILGGVVPHDVSYGEQVCF